MSKQNQTDFVILGLLSIHGNQSGYEIHKTIQQTVGYFWGESYGQIYPTLKHLAAEGLVAAGPSASQGRQKREYSLTETGHSRLKAWLAVPYRDDPPRNEFLLKLFFGRAAPPAISIAHLREFQEKNRRLLAALEQLEKLGRAHNAAHPHFPFWMLTLTYGVSQIRAALEWSESAIAVLTVQDPTPVPPAKSHGDIPIPQSPAEGHPLAP